MAGIEIPPPDNIERVPQFIEWAKKRPKDAPNYPFPKLNDPVNRPAHYNNGPKCECGKAIECIEVTRHHNLLRGTAMKYLWRADHKGKKKEDLEKAIWYIQKEIDTLDE